MNYLGLTQNLRKMSPSRFFATTADVFNAQPEFENEVVLALDTEIKYRGVAPVVGGWGYANGEPVPPPPPVEPAINDEFTKLLLEFDGLERSTTYPDVNGANWPRVYRTGGVIGYFGGITNVGELFPPGALKLDGNTIIVAPDETRFDFKNLDFTIRGYFVCEVPMGEHRTLVSKTDNAPERWVFWCDRLPDGRFEVGVEAFGVGADTLKDRFGIDIVDRFGELIATRSGGGATSEQFYSLVSTTLYTDTVNPGWHKFEFVRTGSTMRLRMDDVEEASLPVGSVVVNQLPGPLIIGGYALPRDGEFTGGTLPWIGKMDRFAIDIGVAR